MFHQPVCAPACSLAYAFRRILLENDGLIKGRVFLEVPPRVEYRLAPSGEELIPFIQYLKDWGDRKIKLRTDNG